MESTSSIHATVTLQTRVYVRAFVCKQTTAMWAIEKEGEKVCLTILGKRAIDPKTKSEYKEITSVEPGRTADELKANYISSSQIFSLSKAQQLSHFQ